MLKATKVRIYPTPEQAQFLEAQFGAVRFIYNKALALKTHYYRKTKATSYHCIGIKVLDNAIKIPKCDPIKALLHRLIEGNIWHRRGRCKI